MKLAPLHACLLAFVASHACAQASDPANPSAPAATVKYLSAIPAAAPQPDKTPDQVWKEENRKLAAQPSAHGEHGSGAHAHAAPSAPPEHAGHGAGSSDHAQHSAADHAAHMAAHAAKAGHAGHGASEHAAHVTAPEKNTTHAQHGAAEHAAHAAAEQKKAAAHHQHDHSGKQQ